METSPNHESLTRVNKFDTKTRHYDKNDFLQISDGKYKSTSVFQTLVTNRQAQETVKSSLFKFEPNTQTFGNTWDVKHFDNFLNNSQWSRGLNTLAIEPGKLNSFQQKKFEESLRDDENKLRQSYFFNHEKHEENNVMKDFSQKIPENRYNQLVIDAPKKVGTEYLQDYYSKNLCKSEKNFDIRKLSMNGNNPTSPLSSPKAQKAELEELKKQRELYAEWKEKNMKVTKKYRILKGAFCSGIVGFDNPLSEDTYAFKEEHNNLIKALSDKKIIQDRYKNEILAHTKTNPEIVFHNKWSKELEDPTKKKELLSKPIVPDNNRKKHIQDIDPTKLSNTHNRLFGDKVDKYSLQRAAYLRNKEVNGKDYNIVTGTINKVEIKMDQGRTITH